MLPQAFLNRMESMLGNEYPAFLESYDKDKYQALRLNSIKGDTAQMQGKVPFSYVLTGFLSLRQERYSWTGKKFIGKNGRFWNCARR